jgi:hypothetical protein
MADSPKWRIKLAAAREAKRIAWETRPRRVQHEWHPTAKRRRHSKKTMAAVVVEYERLMNRYRARNGGAEPIPSKQKSLWANAVAIVTWIRTPAFQSLHQRKRSYINHARIRERARVAKELATATAAAAPPKPVARSRWSLPGV